VLYLGLDDLGTVNDSLGHQAGDRMLKEAANRIRAAVGSLGPVGHIAGDEFAVLLAGPTSMDVLRHASERLLATFNEPFVLGGVEVVPGASIGMALSGPSDTREEVLRNAGMAMALAKANGKRRCEAYTADMEGVARNRLDVVAALRHGLERAEFEVHYQPIVDLTHGGPIGAEALIRWRRPNLGLVPPNAFIPIAEESGLIGPIGAWVLEQACLTAAGWPRSAVSMAPSVAVNVSARQLDDLGFADVVANALRRADLPPARLVLEVTESLMMSNPELLVERLRALKRLGVQIAIDDFGTGYSSLSYLRRLPVDKVKIDRSFVSDLDRSTGFALVRGIIEMTRSLGLVSIAEGIETPEQAATLAAFGCDNGQGFLFGRAVPAANIGHFLSAPFPSHPVLVNPSAQPTAA
jgi:diguanylate cyclase (GGDEF)-like protein